MKPLTLRADQIAWIVRKRVSAVIHDGFDRPDNRGHGGLACRQLSDLQADGESDDIDQNRLGRMIVEGPPGKVDVYLVMH